MHVYYTVVLDGVTQICPVNLAAIAQVDGLVKWHSLGVGHSPTAWHRLRWHAKLPGTSVTIPIEYGKDVLDWWCHADSGEPTRGKVAWKGENDGAKTLNATIRLYLTTWENPKPDLKIKSIDYSSTKQTQAAPFCVAITGEKK
jgi:hypothetical protein